MATNEPVSIWRDTDGLADYSGTSPEDIVDNSDNHLVDTSGNQIVDTGVIRNRIPATEWSEDDSI